MVMRRWAHVLVAAAPVATIAATPSRAAAEETLLQRLARASYSEVTLGAVLEQGRYRHGATTPIGEPPRFVNGEYVEPRLGPLSPLLTGVGAALESAWGLRATKHIGIGYSIGARVLSVKQRGPFPDTVGGALGTHFGLRIDWFPTTTSGWHASAGVGLDDRLFLGTRDWPELLSSGFMSFNAVRGFGVRGAVGWHPRPGGVGFVLRGERSFLRGDDTRYAPVSLSLSLAFGRF